MAVIIAGGKSNPLEHMRNNSDTGGFCSDCDARQNSEIREAVGLVEGKLNG